MMTEYTTTIKALSNPSFPNPLSRLRDRFVREDEHVMVGSTLAEIAPFLRVGKQPPVFEQAGPREKIYFDPSQIACGVVTCGGLCPGLNNVIRSVVLTLHHNYGVSTVYGFRYGYKGVAMSQNIEPLLLNSDVVERIHEQGGTLLGSSRGPQDPDDMVDNLVRLNIKILFTIGGDGTLRGASKLAEAIERRGLDIRVIGIPKTIDNDIQWVERSFGFATSVEEATRALAAAHTEACGAFNGIGLVKLMGRDSGFITAHAALADSDVNFCLVPEVPFTLEGLLAQLEDRLALRKHAVVAVAEGVGQDWLSDGVEKDASGNLKLEDIGTFLRKTIEKHFKQKGMETTIKYIDPSYSIRGLAANAIDSELCLGLGQNAVHAGMSGRTNMMIGNWNRHYTHVPLEMATASRKRIDPQGELWQSILGATGMPSKF